MLEKNMGMRYYFFFLNYFHIFSVLRSFGMHFGRWHLGERDATLLANSTGVASQSPTFSHVIVLCFQRHR